MSRAIESSPTASQYCCLSKDDEPRLRGVRVEAGADRFIYRTLRHRFIVPECHEELLRLNALVLAFRKIWLDSSNADLAFHCDMYAAMYEREAEKYWEALK